MDHIDTPSADTETDSLVQPGVSVYQLPNPLRGKLSFELNDRIGGGSYSNVFRGTWLHDGQTEDVCIKKILKDRIGFDKEVKGLTPEERFRRRVLREACIWSNKEHPNIWPFIGLQIVDGMPWFVSPLARCSLDHYLYKKSTTIACSLKLKVLQEVAQGLTYLHGLSPPIAHGDIKASNVLIRFDGTAALVDFGLARVIRAFDHPTGLTTSNNASSVGLAAYKAKEIWSGASLPTPKSDVYALASLVFEVLTGRSPFHTYKTTNLIQKAIIDGETCGRPSERVLGLDSTLWSLLVECWSPDPDQRPTSERIALQVVLTSNSPNLSSQATAIVTLSIEAPQEISRESVNYNKEDCLGRGYFADVYKGTLFAVEGGLQDVAIKVLNACDMTSSTTEKDRTERLRKRVDRESGTLGALSHSNILPILGVCYGYRPYIITPYCKNGDLDKYLQGHSEIPASHRLRLLLGAARGLEHLHASKPPICHGDVKPRNILINDDGTDVFLCDFGLAKGFEAIDTANATSGIPGGTVRFASPEQLLKSERTVQGDVFSFGCMVLNVMTGLVPWHDKTEDRVNHLRIVQLGAIPDPSLYPQLPKDNSLWDLMARCWSYEPANRPAMTDVVQGLAEKLRETSVGEASNDQ